MPTQRAGGPTCAVVKDGDLSPSPKPRLSLQYSPGDECLPLLQNTCPHVISAMQATETPFANPPSLQPQESAEPVSKVPYVGIKGKMGKSGGAQTKSPVQQLGAKGKALLLSRNGFLFKTLFKIAVC